MPSLDDLKKAVPPELAPLVDLLAKNLSPAVAASAAADVPHEPTEQELALAAKQEELATVAGSPEAASDPGAVAELVRSLHDQVHALQVQVGHILRTQLEVSDVEHAEVTQAETSTPQWGGSE